jgi:hypothetical protein
MPLCPKKGKFHPGGNASPGQKPLDFSGDEALFENRSRGSTGQIAPLELLPHPVRVIAFVLPFRWIIGFPTELLLGRLTPAQALTGIAMQTVWLGIICAVTTIIGGFAAVAYTDTIQTVIMVVGSGLGLLIGLGKVGGWSGLERLAPAARGAQRRHGLPVLADVVSWQNQSPSRAFVGREQKELVVLQLGNL